MSEGNILNCSTNGCLNSMVCDEETIAVTCSYCCATIVCDVEED